MQITSHSAYVGKKLMETDLRDEGVMIVGIRRRNGERLMPPPGNAVIEAGDCLFAFGTLRLQAAPNKKPPETNFAGKLIWQGIQIISGEFRIMWPFPPDVDSESSCQA